MEIRILVVGDIVGSPGRAVFKEAVGALKKDGLVDFVIANAENAAGGRGLTIVLARELFEAGADVLTMGDHVWDQKDLVKQIESEPRILRPANLPPASPGKGWVTLETPKGRVTVINLVGRVFMPPMDCPFRAVDEILGRKEEMGRVIVADVHAEATSEKIALGRYLDGRVSVVVGSHTHVQTADEAVLPGGTAYITDLGMTGPKDSILGRDYESVLSRFVTGLPVQFKVAKNDVKLEGVLVPVDAETGKAAGIQRISIKLQKQHDAGNEEQQPAVDG